MALFAVLALAAVVAGCGGGGSSSEHHGGSTGGSTESSESDRIESGGAAPTKAVFIKEADEVCTEAENELNEEITEYAEENNIPIWKKNRAKTSRSNSSKHVVLPNIAKQGEELAALTPPEGEEDKIEELTSTAHRRSRRSRRRPGDVSEDTLEGATEKAQGLRVQDLRQLSRGSHRRARPGVYMLGARWT